MKLRVLLFCLVFLISMPMLAQRTYTTQFPAAENPISEGNNWINGSATGLQWKNVKTVVGKAYGTQVGNEGCTGQLGQNCNDSTAVISGTWGQNQYVYAVAKVGTKHSQFIELELRCRTDITANNINGYEILISADPNAGYGVQIVKWLGALGSFEIETGNSTHQISDGQNFSVSCTGSNPTTVTVFHQGTQVAQFVDSNSPWTGGKPGMGFFMQQVDSGFTSEQANAAGGWTCLAASDVSMPSCTAGGGGGGGGFNPAYVQNVFTAQTSGSFSSLSGVLPLAQNAGDTNVVFLGWHSNTNTVSSVTDSKGNVYTKAIGPIRTANGGGLTVYGYVAPNVLAASAGTNTVTAVFSAACLKPDLRVVSYRGITGTVLGTKNGTGQNATSNSGLLSVAQSQALLVASNFVTTTTTGPGTGYTSRGLTALSDIVEDKTVNASGSYNATAPLGSSGAWMMTLIALN